MIARGVDAVRRLALRDEGQSLTEYGLLLTLISTVAVLVMQAIGIDVVELISDASEKLSGASGG